MFSIKFSRVLKIIIAILSIEKICEFFFQGGRDGDYSGAGASEVKLNRYLWSTGLHFFTNLHLSVIARLSLEPLSVSVYVNVLQIEYRDLRKKF